MSVPAAISSPGAGLTGSRHGTLHRWQRHRARQRRLRLAAGLEHAVQRSSQRARGLLDPAVPVSREAGDEARELLLDLAERLRQPREVRPEGLVFVRLLLTDGAGPLYVGHPGELRCAAWLALQTLDDDGRAG